MDPIFSPKQGQYLAFIHYYSKSPRRPPSQADMQRFFGVTPPSVYQMVLTLQRKGLISRVPGAARSLLVLVPTDQLPGIE